VGAAVEGAEPESIPLRRAGRGVVLRAERFEHPRSSRGRGRVETDYRDLTHLAASDRFIWIATRRTVYLLPRRLFVEPAGPEHLLRSLLDRVARLPGGAEQLAAMERIEALARRPVSLRATWALTITCVVGFALQILPGPVVSEVGYFSPALFADGDLWRAVTAHLLHGSPMHLALNMAGLWIVGRISERALGTQRTLVVMGAAAAGSMALSAWASDGSVVGASGVVFGVAGAFLWVELHHGEELPAWWRLPRSALLVVMVGLAADGALGLVVPFIAGEAHLGGLLGGLLACAALTGRRHLGIPPGPRVRAAGLAVAALALLSIGAAAVELLGAGDYRAQHAIRLAGLPSIEPTDLNNHAWLIAIAPDASREQMEAALVLAERAVAETRRLDPSMLDTLAEVHFQLGRPDLAIATIDEAIARDPREPYYREQRRRFTGERPPHDRPPGPGLPWVLERRPPLPPDDHGLRV
jgi:membrane associated rhomboid family serine protease